MSWSDESGGFGSGSGFDSSGSDDSFGSPVELRELSAIPTNARGKVVLDLMHAGGKRRVWVPSDETRFGELKHEIARQLGAIAGDPQRMEIFRTAKGLVDVFADGDFAEAGAEELHAHDIKGRRKPTKLWVRFVSDAAPLAATRFVIPPPPAFAAFAAPDRVEGIKGVDAALRAAGKYRLQVRDGRALAPLESLGPDEREGAGRVFAGRRGAKGGNTVIVDETWTVERLRTELCRWLYHRKGSLRLAPKDVALSTAGKHGYAKQFVFPAQRLCDIFDPPVARDGSRSAVIVVRLAAAAPSPQRGRVGAAAALGGAGSRSSGAASGAVGCREVLAAAALRAPKFMRCPPAPIRGVRLPRDPTRADPFLTLLGPERRALGYLLGNEAPTSQCAADGWVEARAVYEPPQCGLRESLVLFAKDDAIYGEAERAPFNFCRSMLGLAVVGAIVSVASRTKVGPAPRAAVEAAAAAAEEEEEEGDGAAALTAAEVQHVAMLPTCGPGFPVVKVRTHSFSFSFFFLISVLILFLLCLLFSLFVKCEFSDAPTILARCAASGALLRGIRRQGAMERLSAARAYDFELAGEYGRANVGGVVRFKLALGGYALNEYALASASRKEKIRLALWRLLFLTKRQLATLDAALEGGGGGAAGGDADAALGFACRDFDRMDPGTRRSVIGLLEQVSFLLCTVTFYANRAHNLTRSPQHL
jgi:hypothetical protein